MEAFPLAVRPEQCTVELSMEAKIGLEELFALPFGLNSGFKTRGRDEIGR
jgi:hypothetical protein